MSRSQTTQTLTPDELQASVNKSAEHLRVLWISYSLFAIYLIITSLSVTHRHLFLELPIRLPVLDIDLGLQDFFVAAPILFIGMHLYFVFHLNVLEQQVVKYQDIIHTKPTEQERKSYLFDPFIFVQSWVGHAKSRRSKIGFAIITHGSLKVFPICVLLLIMLSALPYHDEKLTHYHRFMVMVDFVVITVFAVNWRKGVWHLTYLFIITIISFVGLSITLYGILIFQGEDLYKLREEGFYIEIKEFSSLPFQIFQENDNFGLQKKGFNIKEPYEEKILYSPNDNYGLQTKGFNIEKKSFLELLNLFFKSATTFLLEGEVNYITGKPESLFSNRLILVNEDFVDDEMVERLDKLDKKIDDEMLERLDKLDKKIKGKVMLFEKIDIRNIEKRLNAGMILRKRGRHFENAVFAYSDLRRTDFTGAYISGASFIGSNLEKSNFACIGLESDGRNMKECRYIQNKNFTFQYTDLNKSYFLNFNLQDANLKGSNLQGIYLSSVNLKNTNLEDSNLQGANLSKAQLQGANLYNANLQDANLSGAYLQDANLKKTNLQGADLVFAQLQNADLYNANLQGANLMFAQLQNASLLYANLEDAKLMGAELGDDSENFNGNGQFGEDWIPDNFFEYAYSQDAVFDDTQLEKFNNDKYIKGKSYTNKKAYDQSKKDFLQYHAHKSLCANIVTIGEMIKIFEKYYPTPTDRHFFAGELFILLNTGECVLKPNSTKKQHDMLIQEWFFGRK